MFIKVCVKSLKPKFSNWGEVFSKRWHSVRARRCSDARVGLNFSWGCLIWRAQSVLLKTEPKPPSACLFELSSDKLFQLLVGAYLCMYSCFPSSWACKRSVLNVCLCSVVLSRLPKFIPQKNRAGFSYPSVSLGARDKELTLGSRPPGSPMCVCVCHSVSGFVCLCVCVASCLSMFENAEEPEEEERQVCKASDVEPGRNGFKFQACS